MQKKGIQWKIPDASELPSSKLNGQEVRPEEWLQHPNYSFIYKTKNDDNYFLCTKCRLDKICGWRSMKNANTGNIKKHIKSKHPEYFKQTTKKSIQRSTLKDVTFTKEQVEWITETYINDLIKNGRDFWRADISAFRKYCPDLNSESVKKKWMESRQEVLSHKK